MKENIAIIGMAGAGKTTAAKLLAPQIGYLSFDTDEYVEFTRGQKISEIISLYGEGSFRELEAQSAECACTFDKAVISLGGGAVLDEKVMREIQKTCYIVYLSCCAKTCYARIKKSGVVRPLFSPLTVEKIEGVLSSRKPLYEKYADITIVSDGKSAKKVTAEILDALKDIKY